MRKKQGSAILWVMMMVVSVAAIALVAAELGMSSIRDTIRYTDEQEVQYAWEALCSKIDADGAAGTLTTFPASYTLSTNGATATATVSDYSSTMSNSLLVTATVTAADGRTFTESTVLPKQHTPSPWDYALFLGASEATDTHGLTTGSLGSLGDFFGLGNISFHAGTTLNGNAGATGTLAGATVTGTSSPSTTAPCSWPTLVAADYQGYATTTIATGNYTGYTFSTVTAGNPYPLVYCSGNLTLKGAVSGVGTFYVGGTLDISGGVTYANGSSRVAFITPNNFNLDQNCVGYYFCGGTVTTQAKTMTGALVTKLINIPASPTLISDPTIKNSSNEGVLMHLPGLWTPTNLYAGSYVGTYTVPSAGDSGTMSWTVTTTGAVTGTMHDTSLASNGTIVGTIDNAGVFSGTYTMPGSTWTSNGTMTLSGTSFTGSLTTFSAAYGTYIENVTMTKQ